MSGDAIRFGASVIHPMSVHEDRRKIEFKHNKIVQENLPKGAIAFFDKLKCPAGWASYTAVGTRSIKGATSNIETTADDAHTHTVNADHYQTNFVGGGSGVRRSSAGAAGSTTATLTPAYIKYICCEKVVN